MPQTLGNQPVRRRLLLDAAVLLGGLVCLFARFRRANALAFFDDDLFYYLQIARNLALRHASTFDGIHLTNGYHPLWVAVLTLLTLAAPAAWLFPALTGLIFVCFAVTYFSAQALFRQSTLDRTLVQSSACIIAYASLLLMRGGMEITLTIPLVLLMALLRLDERFTWRPRQAAAYGALAALIILSRLDTVLLIAMLFGLELVSTMTSLRAPILRSLTAHEGGRSRSHPRATAQTAPGLFSLFTTFLTTALLIAAYLLLNHVVFATWTPISAQAKQLRLHHGFTISAFDSVALYLPSTLRYLIVYPALLTLLLATGSLLVLGRQRLRAGALPLIATLLCFPFVQLLALSWLSDWALWPWYLYPWVLAYAGAFVVAFTQHQREDRLTNRRLDRVFALTALVGIMAFTVLECRRTLADNHCYLFGRDLEQFAHTHPAGIYAMGDAAGTAGYLVDQPLVQLEGLVMDAPYLENLRQQRALNDVLSHYHIRYYVTFNAPEQSGCYRLSEPAQAGADAPHMRGTLCHLPLTTYRHGQDTLQIFDLGAR